MTPTQQRLIIQRAVQEELERQADRIRKESAQQVFAVMLKNLHDHHNFTPDKLVELFDQSVKDFECINGKYVKIEDFYALLGELGIKVR